MGKERLKEVVGRVMIVAALSFGASEVPMAAQIINDGQVGAVREEPPLLLEKIFFSSPPAWEKLTQNLKFHLCWGDRSRPEVVLTIDDWWFVGELQEKNFYFLLENGIPAVFFPAGQSLRNYPDFWRKVSKFYPVCNHTQSHEYLGVKSEIEIEREIEGWEKISSEILGEDYVRIMKSYFPFFRLPFNSGSSNQKVLRVVIKKGYLPIGWSIHAYDLVKEGNENKDLKGVNHRVVEHVVKETQNGAIILLHATEWETGDLEKTILGIKGKGYKFVTLNRALGMEDQFDEVPKKWQKKINTE